MKSPGYRAYEKSKLELKATGSNFDLNRVIVYRGKIGKQRRDFCSGYIKQKQTTLKGIELEIAGRAAASGEAVTCRKGCSYCCLTYVEASIRECEAIVYYLYRNENVLSRFRTNYSRWRQQLKVNGDLFKKCEQALSRIRDSGHSEKRQQALADALFLYKMQNIACPFLDDHSCLIYDVRPYTCAAIYTTTPAEWCSPFSPAQPGTRKAAIPDDMFDTTFYHRRLDKPVITFIPQAVHEILEGGFRYLSRITGMEDLMEEVFNEPEVRKIVIDYEESAGND